MMTPRKKLIEVALPLEAINEASAREKSIRHGHPSTLHLWWARRPLAACRAVIFTSLVDDPDDPNAPPAFVQACRRLPPGKNAAVNDTPRQRLFDFIERLVQWESTTDEKVLETARELIRLCTDGNPPPLLDPFAGGGSIPLEAQRLGLEAHASDLNPVAVMINKALIEIPPRFAGQSPVNPRDRGNLFDTATPHPLTPSPSGGEGEKVWIEVPRELEQRMTEVARQFRKEPTSSEAALWQALRNRQLEGRKFRRQQPVGPFVLDFYCPEERLAVEVDGPIHESQRGADAERQRLIEATGIRFVRVSAAEVERNLPGVLARIRAAFSPLPAVGEGPGVRGKQLRWKGAQGLAADVRYYGEWMRERAWERIGHLYPPGPNGETVIAWLWARTVKCPNPACGAQMPLVRSFELSKKKGRQAWVEPYVDPHTRRITFEVRTGQGLAREGTVNRRGATCIACGSPVPFEHIRAEGKAGRMGAQLMAIVTEGQGGRNYYAPTPEHERIAAQVPIPEDAPDTDLPEQALGFRVQLYGMTKHRDLFTPRQLVALTTFSDLVSEAREQVYADALAAGLPDDGVPLRDGGSGARAYAEAVSVYLAFLVDQVANHQSAICTWNAPNAQMRNVFARQAIPMTWDFAESNPFCASSGSYYNLFDRMLKGFEAIPAMGTGRVAQADAVTVSFDFAVSIVSTDPPYYDNIGYADLADYFYIWLRRCLRDTYPDIFGTVLVPKEAELVATPYRFGGDKDAAGQHFERGLTQALVNIRQSTTQDIPVSIYYAFKQSEIENNGDTDEPQEVFSSTGWETMLESMVAAHFCVNGTWPFRTEKKGRAVGIGTNALASSIVLVCRPRPDDAPVASRREFLAALRRELPPALREMQSGSIAPVDLAQAAIGPGMAVYSRYSRVLEADGSPLTVRTALQLINQELDAFLAESEGDVDADTRFCIAWFEQYGFREGEFGVADVLARAKNTSVEGLVNAGVLVAGAGRVRLYRWDELEPGWDPTKDRRPTVWEGVHHLIERLNTHGEEGAARLLVRMSHDLSAEAKNLAYRLYQVCDRKGWAEHALDYNALVQSWPRLQELAQALRQQQPPEQLGMF